MCEVFKRFEIRLDLETTKIDPIVEQKQKIQSMIQTATPKQLGRVEMLSSIGKTVQVNA